MKAKNIIEFAVHGELNQLYLGKIAANVPERQENINAIISYINLGVIELYKRFAIATKKVTINDLTNDATTVIEDDFMYVVSCTGNDDDKTDIPINDVLADLSIFQSAPFEFQVQATEDAPETITAVHVVYSVSPTLITKEEDNVLINNQYLEALVNYIAYKGHASISGNTDEENNAYYQRFEASCKNITRLGLATPTIQSNHKLNNRGFK